LAPAIPFSAVRVSWPVVRLAAVWLATLVAAGAMGWWTADRHHAQLREQLADRAARCAVAFMTEDTLSLTGTRADLETAAYQAVKSRLQRLRAVGPGMRFVYLFRSTDQPGRVVFMADSEAPDSPEVSLPGDDYPEALESPGLQSVLRDLQPSTEGPLRDSFGTWVTAYAPVTERALPGAPRIVLGIDVDSSHWRRELLREGATSAGVVLLLLGVPVAVWQLLRRERGLNREIRRLSAAIQQSHSAVLITTPDRVIEYANDGCVAATGYQREELIGQPTSLLLPLDTRETDRAELLERLLAGERWQGEIRLRRRNGEVFPARAFFSPVRSRDGRVTNLVAVLDDISDLKKAEDALRVARDQAQSADRAKGEFLAVMSHELRTPLNGIIGFASLLQDTPLNPEQADYAETIRKSGEALLTLTNELLDYSRLDAGRMQLDLQACSPRVVVEEAVELLSARAAEKQLELLVSIGPEVPAHIMADPGRLRQVLVNLVGNAIKFTPAGEVEVELNAALVPHTESSRARLEFVVRDSGVGIATEKQDRLFKPFSQVDASSTRRHGGAGLGLAISRSLVQLMEGDIEVTSAPGAGSEFRFHLPVRVIEPAAPLPALPPRQVAVVSSHTRSRQHYARLLQGWGLQVDTFENLTRLPAPREHDVVFVDVPTRDAALWPALLRAHAGLDDAPVVGLVAVSVPAALRDELRASFRALLKKPLRDTLCHAVLVSLLRR
jgi:PAS domain S-box-containing protein